MVASSAARMYTYSSEKRYLHYALQETEWLTTNSDLDKDGILGWGLPLEITTAWGVYPENHEFQITSLFAINGLLDTYDALLDASMPQPGLLLTVSREVIDSIIEQGCITEHSDNSASIWYSCIPEDESYDATNINAMMAGVLSRLSKHEQITNNKYQKLSHKIVQHLMKHKITRENAWLWFYRTDNMYKKYIQDLVHTGYTAYGLLMFRDNQEKDTLIDAEKLLNALKLYKDKKHNFYKRFINKDIGARTWGIAFNLLLRANYSDSKSKESIASEFQILIDVKTENRSFSFTQKDERDFVRVQAAVLLSLSGYYHFVSSVPWYMYL